MKVKEARMNNLENKSKIKSARITVWPLKKFQKSLASGPSLPYARASSKICSHVLRSIQLDLK